MQLNKTDKQALIVNIKEDTALTTSQRNNRIRHVEDIFDLCVDYVYLYEVDELTRDYQTLWSLKHNKPTIVAEHDLRNIKTQCIQELEYLDNLSQHYNKDSLTGFDLIHNNTKDSQLVFDSMLHNYVESLKHQDSDEPQSTPEEHSDEPPTAPEDTVPASDDTFDDDEVHFNSSTDAL